MISINNLSKSYGSNLVLDNINFKVYKNNIVGLLGPNGSGKTTLLKILAGLLQDFEGEVLLENEALDYSAKAKISFVAETAVLNSWWKISNAIKFYRDFFEDFDEEKAKNMLDFFKINVNSQFKSLSKGEKQKANIALTLSRKAEVYLLDEPLGGIDPAARGIILENIIRNYNKNSVLILSTHLISDVEPVLDRAIFLKDKRVLVDDEVDHIRETHSMSLNDYFRKVYTEA